MIFVSWQFLALFATVLAGLRIMPTRESRQVLILLAGIVFYGAGTPWHLFVLATPALVDYACAIRIEDSTDAVVRKRWLQASLVSNLGLLAYFKYADFFVDNVAALLGMQTAPLDIALPVGISFFLFKTMSYVIDVYRGTLRASRSPWQYAMFVSYFPELVAGPIVRASIFLPQLSRSLELSAARTAAGVQRILVGVSKKLLIADRLAVYVDVVFASPEAYAPLTVAGAVVAYSLQIYCDFSGYSDMAIGISQVIGFDLPENFDSPYLATSITDFWRRWHMTLSAWLRDYLYIPLGGNRKGPARTYVNLLVTMLLGGLWHGASWKFVAWGAWHGLGLATHKAWGDVASSAGGGASRPWATARTIAGWTATYAFVCVGWVIFRAENLDTAMLILRKITGLSPGGVSWTYLPLSLSIAAVGVAHVAVAVAKARGVAAPLATVPRSVFAAAFLMVAWLVAIFLLAPLRTNPFIYFQF
jgi:alginate O-acetyltransferase complex protein AlgI